MANDTDEAAAFLARNQAEKITAQAAVPDTVSKFDWSSTHVRTKFEMMAAATLLLVSGLLDPVLTRVPFVGIDLGHPIDTRVLQFGALLLWVFTLLSFLARTSSEIARAAGVQNITGRPLRQLEAELSSMPVLQTDVANITGAELREMIDRLERMMGWKLDLGDLSEISTLGARLEAASPNLVDRGAEPEPSAGILRDVRHYLEINRYKLDEFDERQRSIQTEIAEIRGRLRGALGPNETVSTAASEAAKAVLAVMNTEYQRALRRERTVRSSIGFDRWILGVHLPFLTAFVLGGLGAPHAFLGATSWIIGTWQNCTAFQHLCALMPNPVEWWIAVDLY